MIPIQEYSNWKIYEGAAEGSGRSEKIWLISDDGHIGLFKFPKIDPSTSRVTTEYVSECLAHQLGEALGVSTAKVDIGTYQGRIGSMSYLVTKPNEYLAEGIGFISGLYPNYDPLSMVDTSNGLYYCLEHILQSTYGIVPRYVWLEMMVFDFLIGNADRHQNNWGVLVTIADSSESESGKSYLLRKCPLYDNGSSLCCYVNDTQLDKMFGRDPGPFNALVDTKSKSITRIDGSRKKTPQHKEVVKYLLQEYPETNDICKRFLQRLDSGVIDNLLNMYQPEILSPRKNELIRRFLKRKLEILDELLREATIV